jgi:hypothetical protein
MALTKTSGGDHHPVDVGAMEDPTPANHHPELVAKIVFTELGFGDPSHAGSRP